MIITGNFMIFYQIKNKRNFLFVIKLIMINKFILLNYNKLL